MALGLLCVNPTKAYCFLESRILSPTNMSFSRGSFVASAGPPFAGGKVYTKEEMHTCQDVNKNKRLFEVTKTYFGRNIIVEMLGISGIT